MIPINELVHGAYYKGQNPTSPPHMLDPLVCIWDENERRFLYMRYKFGSWGIDEYHHVDDTNLPETIPGFTPVERIK